MLLIIYECVIWFTCELVYMYMYGLSSYVAYVLVYFSYSFVLVMK